MQESRETSSFRLVVHDSVTWCTHNGRQSAPFLSMITVTYTKEIASVSGNPERFQITLQEALRLLGWDLSVASDVIHVEMSAEIPEGGAKVRHEVGSHIIAMHPRGDQPFPWPTVRHEMLHALLKAVIFDTFANFTCTLPVPESYMQQTFRENIEEYFVRALNVLPMRDAYGHVWHERQITREEEQGFKLMPSAARFVLAFHHSGAAVNKETFFAFIKAILR